MMEFLGYRGPDGLNVWLQGSIGLGHALLRSAADAGAPDRQPERLDGLAITADVRLDSTSELKSELRQSGRLVVEPASDAMLVLHAYATWGRQCVEHLRGDFAFGIWDTARRTLFCARDHFGIKPFYYAHSPKLFLFSNTLNCLKQHPAITSTLNEAAVGDFLLFGLNYDKSTSTFRDIQRLPPAHYLTVSGDTLQIRCYWEPPTETRIRYARDQDYVERFQELLRTAVADRMAPGKQGILLSGGLDSGSVAAVTKDLSQSHDGVALVSYTVGYDSLFADSEGAYARKTAEFLGIPNKYLPLDAVELFDKWDDDNFVLPEPCEDPLNAGFFELFSLISADCRVAFSGEGPDNLMYFQMWPYIQELRRSRRWMRLVAETASYAWVRPFPWRGIKSRIQSFSPKARLVSEFPSWIAPEFARRMGMQQRWRDRGTLANPSGRHAVRPKGYASLALPHWTNMFESQDPGVTRCNVEVRYPYLDLRMVDYLLGIPSYPWLYKKMMVRKAMAGKIPEQVLSRAKTPLAVNPFEKKLRDGGGRRLSRQLLEGPILEFVSVPALKLFCDSMVPAMVRPYCLDRWLRYAG